MKYKSKGKRNVFLLFFSITGLFAFFIWQNNSVVITNYVYTNKKLPRGFDNYKILHVSDLHNKNFDEGLTKKILEIKPDVIMITGDLIDRRNTRIDIAAEFIQQIVKIAPAYYISGNHEQLSGKYGELNEVLKKFNVKNIDNSYLVLNKGEDVIGLMGIADPTAQYSEGNYFLEDSGEYIKNKLKKLYYNVNTEFNILLSHRPEQFNVYKSMNMDLVFSGHAHGGQIRIPFIGGLIAPNQGLFPKYTQGIYNEEATSMVISRGLGNSIFPLRVFNPPELVVVTLKSY